MTDGEHNRNRLLRRVDWRFLLPNPRPATSACLADGLLRSAVELISERLVDDRACAPGQCDLAVAVNPGAEALRRLAAALRPGGACYTEWYTPLAGGPAGVRRRLAAAGFERVACYWAWPWPERGSPSFWLPLDAPAALRFFLASRPPARAISRRAARWLLRVAWAASRRLRLTLPICAIARKPARSESAGDERDLLDTIRSQWTGCGLGPTPERLACLLQTGGGRSVNKVVALVFAGAEPRPRLAVKIARVPESEPALAREAAALGAIEARRPGGVPGVPRPLFHQRQVGRAALGETVLTGRPLWTLLHAASYRDLALRATDWLAELAGRAAPVPPEQWYHRLVEPVLDEFKRSFGPALDPGMLRAAEELMGSLGPLPLVCEQRDFSPWNVLVAPDGGLAVLDWESAEIQGLPLLDLIYFQTYLAFFQRGAMRSGRYREVYREMLDESTKVGWVHAECVARYLARTGVGPANVPALRALVWLIHARSEYQHLAADAGGVPSPERLRGSLFVALLQAELRHATRAGPIVRAERPSLAVDSTRVDGTLRREHDRP